MKLLEWKLNSYINEMANISEMQSGFVPDRGTIDGIFVVRQLQKYITAKKLLDVALIDLEKAFDYVPRKVLLWVLRSFGVQECVVCGFKGMYLCPELSVSQWSVQWGVLAWELVCISEPTALYPGARDACAWVPHWYDMEASLHRWLCAHCRHPGGVYLQAQGMEGWHGK